MAPNYLVTSKINAKARPMAHAALALATAVELLGLLGGVLVSSVCLLLYYTTSTMICMIFM